MRPAGPLRLWQLLPIAVVLSGACSFSPALPSGGIQCGAGQACPAPLVCEVASNLCVSGVSGDGGGGSDRPSGGDEAGQGGPSSDAGCSLLDPASCGGGGQTCRSFCSGGVETPRCGPVGTAKRSERCASDADCAGGMACLFGSCAGGGQVGVCKPFCATDSDCGPGSVCAAITCGGMATMAFKACRAPCDPTKASGVCPTGTTCGVLSGSDAVDCFCSDAGTVAEGGKCDTGSCKPGLICTFESGSSVCRPVCRMDDPAGCAAGRHCVPVASHVKYGGCSPGAGPPPVTPSGCDLTLLAGCPSGQACRLSCTGMGTGKTSCTAGVGTKQLGETCTADADCVPGFLCLTNSCPNGTKLSTCRRACKSDPDCGAQSECGPVNCDSAATPFGACAFTCDPTGGATTGCPTGLNCALFSGDRTTCVCRTGGMMMADGGACTTGADCQPGLICVQRGGASTCRPVCRMQGNDCAADRSCVSLPDHRTYGACVPTAGDMPPACDPSETTCGAGMGCSIACSGLMPQVTCAKAGTVAAGQICTSPADCVPGADCLGTTCAEGGSKSRCVKHCKTDADCGGSTTRCLLTACIMGTQRMTVPYGRCTLECDPRGAATTGCAAGLNCYLLSGEITDCRCRAPSQTGADGVTCTISSDCQPGLTCVLESAGRACRALCRLDQPSTCPTGRTCTPLPDQRIFGACEM